MSKSISTAPALAHNRASAPHAEAALFVVFNVGAGAGDAALVRAVIEDGCAAADRTLHLINVDHPEHLHAIAADAVRRAQACGGIVVAAGGDGTLNAVAQVVLGSGCAFGVLPQGTFNYFSRAHGIPLDTHKALHTILNGHTHEVQVGLVNERVFLVNASLGLYPTLLENREEWKQYLGRNQVVAFGAAFFTLMRAHRSLRLRLEGKDAHRSMRTPMLIVGNNALQLQQLGLPMAQAIQQGELAGIVLRPVGRLAMLGLLLRGALGQLGDSDRILSFPFKRLAVHGAWPFRARRIKVATDGEIEWLSMPLEFRVAPQPLLLIQPAASAPQSHAP